MKKVYIASPYTKGDIALNVKNSMDAATTLMDLGFAPFCPLLTHFLHIAHPRPYQDWVAWDNEWVVVCDALLRLPGDSRGADAEVQLAKQYHIPVFSSIRDLLSDGSVNADGRHRS